MVRMRNAVRLVVIMALAGFVSSGQAQVTDDRPLEEQPYLGLSVRHDAKPNKCIVAWIYPGPLNGVGMTADFNIQRGDYVLFVGSTEVHTPDDFDAALKQYQPGDEINLQIYHTEGDPGASIPTAGSGDVVEIVNVRLDSRASWSGPVAWLRDDAERVVPSRVVAVDGERTELESAVFTRMVGNDIYDPFNKLVDYFHETLGKNYGANMLDRVAYGFHYPTRLAELQVAVTNPLPEIANDPRLVLREAAANIDSKIGTVSDGVDISDPANALRQLARMVNASQAKLDVAFGVIDANEMTGLKATYPELVEYVADNFYINDHPDVGRLIRALDVSMKVDFGALLDAGGTVAGAMVKSDPGTAHHARVPIPEGLSDAVSGDVIGVFNSDGRWFVYGGMGENHYDLSKIDVVVDAGGNDIYSYSSNDRPSVQVVIDAAGDDSYSASADEGIAGPASAVLGVNLLVDYAGNDTYEGGARSCGVGVMGVGVLVDYGGADHYTGTRWSDGAAFYGCGAILDLGGGNDVYSTHHFSQAIGGPRGFGLILDAQGRDLYRNNGPVPSVYGTPAVYSGISQGVGFGVRGYETGGIGVMCDLAGDDRYEAGEFSQGGAYFWGLGILNDKSGRDLFYGNRYTQGFAAHQALGVLADDGGDDTYWGMTAATQSGSWDICSTLLIDRGGNDTYQADGLAQGGASMQAIAWLVDLDGSDRYNAPNGATQGQSGGDSYHYDATKCFSFSLLLDAGGGWDIYNRADRKNNSAKATGEFNANNQANSSLYGLFIDLKEAIGSAGSNP